MRKGPRARDAMRTVRSSMQKQFDLDNLDETVTKSFNGELAALDVDYGPKWPDRFGEALERWSQRSFGEADSYA